MLSVHFRIEELQTVCYVTESMYPKRGERGILSPRKTGILSRRLCWFSMGSIDCNSLECKPGVGGDSRDRF